uniref:Signal transduction response regulator n=1 Tax=Rheinheimera sp. BAL341 TaxID=1708203 RepID=A0A486XS62_9GAMM
MSDSFFFGDWQVDHSANTLRKGKQLQQLEPKAMDVLLLLCRHAGEVLSSEDIVSQCWPGIVTGDNPLHKTLTQLRKALGDSATAPTYIETIRKRGYRTLAEVRFPLGQQQSVAEHSWQQGSPFPGLQTYDAHYASVFFGRGAQIDTLLSRIAQQIKFGRDFCLLLGPSGSGKSSLINAGVMPNLMQPGGYNGIEVLSFASLDLADVSQGQLFASLASTLLDWELEPEQGAAPVFDGDSASSLADKLQQQPEQLLQHCAKLLGNNRQRTRRFALFVDRLEVLLSSPLFTEQQRLDFVGLLEQLASSGAVLVLSACRNEFYPDLVDYPSLMAGKAKGAHFDLAAPGRTELLQMIRLPALAAGLSFDTDPETAQALDEILVQEAASNPDALPMLQYTLQQLYLQRSSENKLLLSVYNALGGIEGAIGKNAENAIKSLSKAEQDSLPKVLSLLVTLREDEQSITSRSARLAQLGGDAERALVHTMVEQRLFVSHLQHGEPCFSIAHEALLRRWPRATAWITEHHDSLSVKSRLRHLSQRWRSEQQNSAYLLAEGKPLQEALLLQQNRLFQLDSEESEFIHASKAKARLKRWTRRGTFATLCLLTVTAVTMGVRSFNAEQQALQKRLAAENLLGFMVGDFADKLRSIGRMDLLDGISNKALEYFTNYSSDDSSLSIAARLQHGQTLEAMGEVAYSRGKTDEAVAALQAARVQLEAVLTEQPDNLELLKTLGANAFWLGQIHYDASDWQAVQPEFERYYQYSERMYELAPDNLDAIMELSYATNSLGSLAMKQQQFDTAKKNFTESLRLKLLAQEQQPGVSYLIADIADTRSWLASAVLSQGDVERAIEEHSKIHTEFEDLIRHSTPDAYLLEKVFSSYDILASIYSVQGHYQKAADKALLGHLLIEQALFEDNNNEIWRSDLFKLKLNLMQLSFYVPALQSKFSAEALRGWLNENKVGFSDEKRFAQLELSWMLDAAEFYQNTGLWQQSDNLLSKARVFASEVEPDSRIYVSQLLLDAKQRLYSDGDAQSKELCQQALAILAMRQVNHRHPDFVKARAEALLCLGELDKNHKLLQIMKRQNIKEITFGKLTYQVKE